MSRQQTVAAPLVVHLYGNGQVGSRLRTRFEESSQGFVLGAVHTRSKSVCTVAGRPDIVVDATAPQYVGPEAESWISTLEGILRQGTSLVTCNKAPLALAWDRLHAAAWKGGATIHLNATVGAGTPILTTLARLQTVRGISHIKGTLSGTLAYVLQTIATGSRLSDAVTAAQRLGYAEPDPTLDLNGTDAAAKATILHNALFGHSLRLADAEVRLPLHAAEGSPPLAAVATVEPGRLRLGLHAAAPLDQAPGTIRVEAFHPDGTTTIIAGPGASPDATAACLWADLVEAARDQHWRPA